MHVAFVLALAAALQASPAETPAPRRSLAPTPAPPLVLEGTVKGPDGKAVENAVVVALTLSRGNDEPPLSIRSDARGRFRLALKRPGALNVQIHAPGLAPWTGEKVMPGSLLDIALQKGLAVEGVVRDGGSGAPVPNARVTATIGVSLPWEPESGVVSATADAKGRYRLDGLAKGHVAISARAPGYTRSRHSSVSAGGTADFNLLPGTSLTGLVLGPDGKPIANAVVIAESDARPAPSAERTDATGRFELSGIETGSYTLYARHPEFAPGMTTVLVERGLDTAANVSLSKGATVSGRLLGPDDAPVAGTVMVQELNERPVGRTLAQVLRADAGADGRFELAKVPPGSHALKALAPGHASARVDCDIGARAAAASVGDIVLEKGLSIRGRVGDRAGHPIPDARIVGWVQQPGGLDSRAEADSGADGRFILSGLAQSSYRLMVSASGYGEAWRTVAPGEKAIEFVLEAAGHVTGQVVDDTGTPADWYALEAEPADKNNSARSIPVASDDGRFRLEDLSPGTYVLRVTVPDRAPSTRSDVVVEAGRTVDVGRIRLALGGVVRGTISDPQGTPIPAANVSIETAARGFTSWGGTASESTSDLAGAFEVRGLAEGAAFAVARHPDYVVGRSEPFEVDAKGAVEARIVMTRGGRIEGSARSRDGGPVGSAMVSAVPLGAAWGGEAFSLRSDGTFTIEHVPAGRVRVSLLLGGGTGRFTSTSALHREVEVREDETSEVDFVQRDILVSGQVRRGGQPAPGLRVLVRGGAGTFYRGAPAYAPASSPQRLMGVTGEDGRFELLAEPGTAQVVVESIDRRVSLPMRSVDIPDADTFQLDLDFAGITVAGLVTDRQTAQPIPEAHVSAQSDDTAAGATSGADGRFQFELPEGRYRLNVRAEDYAPEGRALEVPGSGELQFALSRGALLKGKVVDMGGRGVASLPVTAATDDPDDSSGRGWANTLPDGSFQFEPMLRRPVNVFAGHGAVGFGVTAGIVPGEAPVTVTLRPPGRARLLVRGTDGLPVVGARCGVTQIDGARVMGVTPNPGSDAQGIAEAVLPAGRLEIRVWKDDAEARVSLEISEGGSASAEVTLVPKVPGR